MALITSRMLALRSRPPGLAGGMSGSKRAHWASVRSVEYGLRFIGPFYPTLTLLIPALEVREDGSLPQEIHYHGRSHFGKSSAVVFHGRCMEFPAFLRMIPYGRRCPAPACAEAISFHRERAGNGTSEQVRNDRFLAWLFHLPFKERVVASSSNAAHFLPVPFPIQAELSNYPSPAPSS